MEAWNRERDTERKEGTLEWSEMNASFYYFCMVSQLVVSYVQVDELAHMSHQSSSLMGCLGKKTSAKTRKSHKYENNYFCAFDETERKWMWNLMWKFFALPYNFRWQILHFTRIKNFGVCKRVCFQSEARAWLPLVDDGRMDSTVYLLC